MKQKYTDIRGAMERYGFGKNKMTQIANDAGAVIVINSRCKRYDIEIIDKYFEDTYSTKNSEDNQD